MPIVDIEIEIEVYCATCGAGLCRQTDYVTTPTRRARAFRVDVCSDCVDSAVDKAVDKAVDEVLDKYNLR